MRRRAWLGRVSLLGFVALAGSLPYGCGSTSKRGNGVGAGGEPAAGGSAGATDGSGESSVIPCASDKVCLDSGRLCDTTRGVCVVCRDEADCGEQELCLFSECVGYTPCESSRQCGTDQVCDEASGICVQCVGDGDCADAGVCVHFRCHAPCESDKTCVASGQLCDEANGYCLDCVKDGDCDGGYCEAGLCHQTVCEPGDAVCLGDTLLSCDEHGSAYLARECIGGCSETDGAHCAGQDGTGGASGNGGASGTAGAGGENSACGESPDLQTDSSNCGACGYACVHGRACVAGRCTPAWQPLETTNAPPGRTRHGAGFVAGKYVVFGGAPTNTGKALDTTAAYDVEKDTWSNLPALNAARCSHEGVSTGSDILAFGGLSDCGNGASIGPALERFTPSESGGSWSTVNASDTPGLRYQFASTWTGNALFVFGGSDDKGPAVATGGLFSPAGSSWTATNCALQDCERGSIVTAFTDGDRVRVWGGAYGSGPAGLFYDLKGKNWGLWLFPAGSDTHLAKRFADDGRRLFFLAGDNRVTIYDRQSTSWLDDDTADMPFGFCPEGATAWTGSELIAWSGSCGVGPKNLGGRYQPPAPAD